MRPSFPLFQSHLDLAAQYWKSIIRKGASVIDATCGNGHDTVTLAALTLEPNIGSLFVFDIQEQAITSTKDRVTKEVDTRVHNQIYFEQRSHASFPDNIPKGSVTLIVYNLGYLPGGDKTITTTTNSTIESLGHAQTLLKDGGVISITSYSGHPKGKIEEQNLENYVKRLSKELWSCCWHRWVNRSDAPCLWIIQRALSK